MLNVSSHRYLKLAGLTVLVLLWGGTADTSAQPREKQFEWHSFEEALQIADSTDRWILIDVWAPWCGWCHKMKREVYPLLPPEIAAKFIWTRLNRDDHDASVRYRGRSYTPMALAREFRAQSVPAIVLLSPSGNYLLHISGFIEAGRLRSILESATGSSG